MNAQQYNSNRIALLENVVKQLAGFLQTANPQKAYMIQEVLDKHEKDFGKLCNDFAGISSED